MRVMMTWAANFTAPEINEYKTREQHWRLISDAEAAGRGYMASPAKNGVVAAKDALLETLRGWRADYLADAAASAISPDYSA